MLLNVQPHGTLAAQVGLGGGGYPQNEDVNMGEMGYSTGPALYTFGAGPCMNVVVHNTMTDEGCLAHIWNASLRLNSLWQNAAAAVRQMLQYCGGPAEIVLAAGSAFHLGPNIFAPLGQNPPAVVFGMSLTDYLFHQLTADGYAIQAIYDARHGVVPATGELLYIPAQGEVFVLNNAEHMQVQGQTQHGLAGTLTAQLANQLAYPN